MNPGATTMPLALSTRFARQRLGRDASDLAVADADVARGVEAGLGIHHPPAFNDEIVLLCERAAVSSSETRRNELCAWVGIIR